MDTHLLHIFSWTNPVTSFGCLVTLNGLCWFVHNERPLFVISLVLLFYYSYNLWKYRIESEVLIDPPDQEEWITLSTYEMKNVAIEFVESLRVSLLLLRKEHYFMWFIITTVFWIFLAKLASSLNFLSLLLLFVNTIFLLGLLVNKFQLDFHHYFVKSAESGSAECESEEILGMSMLPAELLGKPKQRDETLKISVRTDCEQSLTHPEPESLTVFHENLPSHEDSSDDEFIFDADCLESSASSVSNSFELIHF